MNRDQFKGLWMQFKGELKSRWGEFTDDDIKMVEGDYDKLQGRVQERYGNRKDEVMRWIDAWQPSEKVHAHTGRNR